MKKIETNKVENRASWAPVVLFVYSRLEHTKRTIEALKQCSGAKETELYVFCDAPNPKATEAQVSEIHATHAYLKTVHEGFAKVHLEISQEHRGAGKAIIRGISVVLAKCGRCIILENDMEVEPLFLEYMNKGLDAYESDKKIFGVSSTSYTLNLPRWYKKDVFLLTRPESWGWGTWLDRWQDVNWEVKDFETLRGNKKLQDAFNIGGNDLYIMLEDQMEGRSDTWDLQWAWHIFKKKGYFVYSRWCFQHNSGFDGSGKHCGTNDGIQQYFAPMYPKESLELEFPALRPYCTIIKRFEKYYNRNLSFVREISFKTKVKRLIKRVLKIVKCKV